MAENTRLRDLINQVTAHEQQLSTLERSIDHRLETSERLHAHRLDEFNRQLQEVFGLLQNMQLQMTTLTANPQPGILGASPSRPQPPARSMKIDFPRFGSGDPGPWLFAVDRYFRYHQIPEMDRLDLVCFNLDMPAACWFEAQFANGQLPDWQSFVLAINQRFGPSEFEDPLGSLAKLQQFGSVIEFQTAFELIARRVTDLTPVMRKSLFIAGLKPQLRRAVLVHRPIDMTSAFSFAKIYEDQFAEARVAKPWVPRTTQSPQPIAAPPITIVSPSNYFKPNPSLPPIPIKRLSPAEMQVRRDKNLCYNCDEIFVRGHKCKGRATLLYLEGTDDEPPDIPPDHTLAHTVEEVEPPSQEVPHEISFNALFGHQSSNSFRLQGTIYGQPVQLLIDGGSTHNFITSRMASHFHLTLHVISPFKVRVGNGDALLCSASCNSIPVNIQSHVFTIDVYVIDLKGADIVMGVQWLSTLGPIVTDYAALTMSFVHNNTQVLLQGAVNTHPSHISSSQLHKLMVHNSVSSCLMCFTTQSVEHVGNSGLNDAIPGLSQLLHEFADVFLEPTSLPPDREYNHHIHLLPNSKPVQVRPYRYPHCQKNEIEKFVTDMLKTGVIQNSRSAFSSPVLLVKKKDGTWRFCVDYRALNAITVQDKFPIPTIDELLDELHGATIFSKLDLRSSYHQSEYKKYPYTTVLLQEIQKAPNSMPDWRLRNGLLFHRHRIYIPAQSSLIAIILHEYHASVQGGHSGIQATLQRITRNFTWKGIRKDIKNYIQQCEICQKLKPPNHSPFGLLQPLQIPETLWAHLSMDFITHLPMSAGFTAVMVVVDRFSKAAHFIPLPTHYSASKVAQLIWDFVGKLHGLPESIVSDRDPIFLSDFWRSLFKL
ncbi:uncharacterized protein LOC133302059 [Gastrolobium bilobum]|uniref:uncharacterized protein LOC133302059 n=1 Tax=Gastrolobium bilobum TaxID=150636 RepID=UPI002AB30072|nr:uncharacterized protein LOC133302059 [Gastrolobium bilobum]